MGPGTTRQAHATGRGRSDRLSSPVAANQGFHMIRSSRAIKKPPEGGLYKCSGNLRKFGFDFREGFFYAIQPSLDLNKRLIARIQATIDIQPTCTKGQN